ncbi:MAG: site-specific DNA-methyltransferase [Actinomycetia bacterium]|nr:site-specific DNA-methyltransferase [Actinomycetes bacterium]MCP4960945.1 site-specific DNA-methyltransferase [Actinomycetes bacterium]
MNKSAPSRRGTSTTSFGTGARESHDSSSFYARFVPPEISTSTAVHGAVVGIDSSICFEGDSSNMQALPDNSVALVVTSPPYFVGKEYELAVTSDADQLERRVPESYFEFLTMLRDVFAECLRVLEPGGRIAVNVANLGRKPYRSLSADVISILQDELGMLLRGEVIWQKGKTSSSSCAWGSFAKAGNPVLRDTTERVLIASKGRFDRAPTVAERKKRGLPWKSTITNDEFVDVTSDVWELDAASATQVGHPAPFPVELPKRLIDLYTYEGDLVLDPFAGSGTTLVAAERQGRIGVGYDTEPEYVDLANGRVDQAMKRRERLEEATTAVEQQLFTLHQELFRSLEPDEREEHFQRRAVMQGRKVQDIAHHLLEEVGFIVDEKAKVRGAGVQFNFLVTSATGERQWYVDVSGAFTTSRPGLLRTDTLWKTLGRISVLKSVDDTAEVLVLTSNLPRRNSPGEKAIKALGPHMVFDALELYDPEARKRLKRYAQGESESLPGFWSEADLAGAD